MGQVHTGFGIGQPSDINLKSGTTKTLQAFGSEYVETAYVAPPAAIERSQAVIFCGQLSVEPERIPQTFFAMHEQLGFGDPAPNAAFQFNTLGKGTSVGWANIESTEGTYSWTRVDLYVAEADRLGSDWHWTIGALAAWAHTPSSYTLTAQTNSGSNVFTVADASGMWDGANVTHANLPANTYVVSHTATTFTTDNNATSNIASGQVIAVAQYFLMPIPGTTPGGHYASGEAAWRAFLTAFCNRYATKTINVEMGNEPSETGNETLANRGCRLLAWQAEIAGEIVRSICPHWRILTPSMFSGRQQFVTDFWIESALNPSGNAFSLVDNTDILTIHGYPHNNFSTHAVRPENWFIDTVNGATGPLTAPALLAAIPAAIASKPMWCTEGGWGQDDNLGTGASPDLTKQPQFVPRWLAMAWAKGIKRAYWYTMTGGNGGTLGTSNWGDLENQDGTLRAAGTAWVQTFKWLIGAHQFSELTVNGTVWSIIYTRPTPAGYVGQMVWDYGTTGYDGSSSFTVPAGYNFYRDITGASTATSGGSSVTIGPAPLFFETHDLSAYTTAQLIA